METPGKAPKQSTEDESGSVQAKSRLALIGFILSILGSIISGGSLLIIMFIMAMAGALDILDAPMEELTLIMYTGFFLGIAGGGLGVVSLRRRESKGVNAISVTLGGIMLCMASGITLLIVVLSLYAL